MKMNKVNTTYDIFDTNINTSDTKRELYMLQYIKNILRTFPSCPIFLLVTSGYRESIALRYDNVGDSRKNGGFRRNFDTPLCGS